MIQNYLKIAYRSFLQNRVYSIVNIIGLSVSMAIVMLIMLYVKDDLSFDEFHTNGKNIYRLVADVNDGNNETRKTGNTGHIQAPIFQSEIPEITSYCRIKNGWNTLVKKGEEALLEEMIYTDSTFLTTFTFNIIYGDAKTALKGSNKIVITEEVAQRYFGKTDVVGLMLNIADEASVFKPYEITAVVENIKSNSSIQFDVCASFQNLLNMDSQYGGISSWVNSSLNTFLLLRSDASPSAVDQKMRMITDKYLLKEYEADKKQDPKAQAYTMDFNLQPLFQMHLDAEYFASNGLKHWSDAKYPKIMTSFALILLLIASINFINLALARSLLRTKEIGIRKSTGGTRQQLFFQFLSEAFLITLIAVIPALLLANSLLPEFSDLTNKYYEPNIIFSPLSILLLLALALLIALASGGYPAFVMSGFQPIQSLRGKAIFGNKHQFKQGLVIFQFAMAAVLMIGTAFVQLQFKYINSKPLGYETENRIRFWLPWEKISRISKDFKQEVSKLAYVENVSGKSGDYNKTKYRINGHETDWIYYEHVDDQHLQLMKVPLVAGRYFSYKYTSDTLSNIIVNESFVNKYLNGKDPLTTPLQLRDGIVNIVGVAKDFHYSNFREKIEPIVFMLDRFSQTGCIHVHYKEDHFNETLAGIKSIYKKYEPYLPLEYQSLKDFRMEAYAEEIREKKIITYTALIAIFIACLGMFGLATFMTEQRSKEMGIRKVLGAGLSNIIGLLTFDFVKLVVVAFVVAIPLAYYLTIQWLQDFSYRIEINWVVFVIVFIIAITISILTVGYQSIRTALVNPVKVLKTE